MTYAIYIALQIALLALWADAHAVTTRLTWAVTTVAIVSFLWFSYVSYLEHVRSVRPSTILSLYLGISSVLDLARSRTLFFIPGYDVVAKIQLAAYFVKLVLFAAEITEKRRLFMPEWEKTSTEAAASFYNRVLFIWLNQLFLKGYKTLLTVSTLMPLDQDILDASRPTKLQQRWRKGNDLIPLPSNTNFSNLLTYTNVTADKSNQNALLWTFASHYKWDLLAGVLPRLAYIGFTFTEPFLVHRVLDFTVEPDGPNTRNIALGLVAAYAIVHIGKAVR